MKYLVISYNDHDKEWVHHGSRDTYEEAEKLAAVHNWQSAPYDLNFTPRTDFLEGMFSAWEGHDQYFIIPVIDRSDE